ncbi:uncharacterized protein LOC134698568 [Mytilus trossulus]|uniref:uncharacterized protein LOC134698568 n=1 Tax=Mytilus trossulus TaxID=6551 RepID=UPI003003E0D6
MEVYMCISCDREVRPIQHAVSCDVCERWQHRLCGTVQLTKTPDMAMTYSYIHKKYTILEEKIQTAWDQYMGNVITTTHFLKVIAKLYKPSDNHAKYFESTEPYPGSRKTT